MYLKEEGDKKEKLKEIHSNEDKYLNCEPKSSNGSIRLTGKRNITHKYIGTNTFYRS